MILAGDVGGTKTHLGYVSFDKSDRQLVADWQTPTGSYPSFEALLEAFLAKHRMPIDAACFGMAAPVVDGCSQKTNLPWAVDFRPLQRLLGAEAVWLINDLEATGYGVLTLRSDEIAVLQAGKLQPKGMLAVLAAGTSLGDATLIWEHGFYRAFPSEGGHADFAPRTPTEWALHQFLAKLHAGHVSTARVVSGQGLVNIYRFLTETSSADTPASEPIDPSATDAAATICAHGLAGRSTRAEKALDLFASAYGAAAGNLALRALPSAGLYLGGGIAPKMLSKLEDGAFMQAFAEKGRLKGLLSEIPVRVILNQQAAPFGAAYHAHARRALSSNSAYS